MQQEILHKRFLVKKDFTSKAMIVLPPWQGFFNADYLAVI
jgi:hypothetical protein